jgi:hypothetical protein
MAEPNVQEHATLRSDHVLTKQDVAWEANLPSTTVREILYDTSQ